MPERFAAELRRLVLQRGSIAKACLATGINRQQFNKYLAGQMLPSSRTLRKICHYLGVSEAQLLSGRSPESINLPGDSEIDWSTSPPLPSGRNEEATAGLGQQQFLRPGRYRCYYPVHGHPGLLARWLLNVWEGPGGRLLHTCRNRFEDAAGLGFVASSIRYRGPVIHGLSEACLIGHARLPHPVSGIVSINLRPVVETDYYASMVLTHRASGPLALSGPVHYLGAVYPARRALSEIGIIRLDDPALDPVIRQIMQSPSAFGEHWLQPAMAEALRAGAEPGGSSLPEAPRGARLSV